MKLQVDVMMLKQRVRDVTGGCEPICGEDEVEGSGDRWRVGNESGGVNGGVVGVAQVEVKMNGNCYDERWRRLSVLIGEDDGDDVLIAQEVDRTRRLIAQGG
ncbi:hypothetical protein HanIR_Chr15g0786021 [Helianthus annuus]|nr:hypothetical protein HanIR_Chr15g0786021 [Helianthus annuus]